MDGTMFSIGLIAVLICLAGITADPKPNPEPEPKPNPKDIHIHLHGLKGVAGSGGMDGKMAEESGGIEDESAAEFGIWRIWQKIWRMALSSKPTILSWRTQRSLFYHQQPQNQVHGGAEEPGLTQAGHMTLLSCCEFQIIK